MTASSIDVVRASVDDRQRVVIDLFKDHPDPDEHGVRLSAGTDLPSFLAPRFNFHINSEILMQNISRHSCTHSWKQLGFSFLSLHHTSFHSRNKRIPGHHTFKLAVPVTIAFSMPPFL